MIELKEKLTLELIKEICMIRSYRQRTADRQRGEAHRKDPRAGDHVQLHAKFQHRKNHSWFVNMFVLKTQFEDTKKHLQSIEIVDFSVFYVWGVLQKRPSTRLFEGRGKGLL